MCEFWQYSCGHRIKTKCGIPKDDDLQGDPQNETFKKLSTYSIDGSTAINESSRTSPNMLTSPRKSNLDEASTSTSNNLRTLCTGFPSQPKKTTSPCFNCLLDTTKTQMSQEKPLVEKMKAKRDGAGTDNWGYSSHGMVGFGEGGNSSWQNNWPKQTMEKVRVPRLQGHVRPNEMTILPSQSQFYPTNEYGYDMSMGMGPPLPPPMMGYAQNMYPNTLTYSTYGAPLPVPNLNIPTQLPNQPAINLANNMRAIPPTGINAWPFGPGGGDASRLNSGALSIITQGNGNSAGFQPIYPRAYSANGNVGYGHLGPGVYGGRGGDLADRDGDVRHGSV